MGFRSALLAIIALLAAVSDAFLAEHAASSQKTGPTCDYCYLGSSCWPSNGVVIAFGNTLDGDLLNPLLDEYRNVTIMKNTAMTKYPAFIVMAETTSDVQKSVIFANRYKIQVAIQSSGHDYIGRSTVDGGIMINLSKMTNINVRPNDTARNPAGEIDLGTGNNWARVYEEIDKYDRVVVGGSAKTVAIGGYTLGGGHSPICRKFGLAVDNLLEVELVTATGAIIIASENGTTVVDDANGSAAVPTNDSDLFWALRGGGGGTFGIVTRFTFKIHFPPKSMVRFGAQFPMLNYTGSGWDDIGSGIITAYTDLLRTSLAPEWGGYLLLNSGPVPNTTYLGSGSMFFNHYGEWGSPSFNTILPLLSALENKSYTNFVNRSSFWEYEQETYDPLYYRQYIMSTILHNDSFTEDLLHLVRDQLTKFPFNDSAWGGNLIMLGGKMREPSPDSTAVNPAFRMGTAELAFGLSWPGDGSTDIDHIKVADEFSTKLRSHGNGTYYNEACAYLPNWKTDYWGNHYGKLLQIKARWDPHNVFTCHHCVGSDEKHNI